jgi:type I restriction enzyme M protein
MCLKMLDETERTLGLRASLFPLQAERFRWSSWRMQSGTRLARFLSEEVLPYMTSLMREAPQVAEYFKDAALEIRAPGALEDVVRTIDGMDLTQLGSTTGEVLEHLLNEFSGPETEYRTPTVVRKLMVQLVDPDLGETVYDPACGTAGFLVDVAEHIAAKYSPEPRQMSRLHGAPLSQSDWEQLGDSLCPLREPQVL